MCLILFAHQVHPRYPMIVAANRDEFYSRPTAPLNWRNNVLCGQDLVAGGSWFGVDAQGRWAAVTNFRDPFAAKKSAAPTSRGKLVSGFLNGELAAKDYLDKVVSEADNFNSFNLLASDRQGVFYFGDRNPDVAKLQPLKPGVYGLSNHLLNTSWPKVELGKSNLQSVIEQFDVIQPRFLFELLEDETRPLDEQLPNTGVGIETERLLSSAFIQGDDYGTRCSTCLLVANDDLIQVAEKSFPSQQIASFEFVIRH